MSDILSPKDIIAGLADFWSPRIIADIGNVYIKVAKAHGALAWHRHENEDELFFILKGQLRIEMEDRNVDLCEGEMFVVPRNVLHNPIADEECHILLVERKSTQHTGDVMTAKTRSLADQFG